MNNNYEYIIASLPELTAGWKFGEKHPEDYIEEIVSLCSPKDRLVIEFFREGLVDTNLDQAFYEKASAHPNAFIREYFLFDMNVRNTKVKYLNKALSRSADRDIMNLPSGEFEEAARLENILNSDDILSREKGMDDLMWEKIDALTTFNYFDITAILGFIAKLHIVTRWFELDERSGREMFKRLVDEVRGTFRGVEYTA